jgi:hypothetical protein
VTEILQSVQLCGNDVSGAHRVNFSISQYYICEYSCQRPGEVITTDFIDSFITSNFRTLSVRNKMSHLPQEKAFLNAMFPTNVEKMDIKQAMKYIDHDHQNFLDFYSSMGDKQQRGKGRIKYYNNIIKTKIDV